MSMTRLEPLISKREDDTYTHELETIWSIITTKLKNHHSFFISTVSIILLQYKLRNFVMIYAVRIYLRDQTLSSEFMWFTNGIHAYVCCVRFYMFLLYAKLLCMFCKRKVMCYVSMVYDNVFNACGLWGWDVGHNLVVRFWSNITERANNWSNV